MVAIPNPTGPACRHLISPATLPHPPADFQHQQLSVLSYNVLLPNSKDGWWNYKMYLGLTPEEEHISTWKYRQTLIKNRIGLIDADVVCFQEVSPISFEEDFAFMAEDLGYDGVELFRKGRFRPATFWKKDRVELVTRPQHKDRTMLTSFRILGAPQQNESPQTNAVESNSNNNSNKKEKNGKKKQEKKEDYWHVLNCHLQAGKQGGRRVRQIVEGVTTAVKAAKKLKEEDPSNLKLVVCGDFNGGSECGAVQYLERGSIGPDFLEDGEQVASKEKALPLSSSMTDVYLADGLDRPPPATLVVPELIPLLIEEGSIETCFINPEFSKDVKDRFERIYKSFATVSNGSSDIQMGKADAERWLTAINGQVGRGSEFRNAAKFMGWVEPVSESEHSAESESTSNGNSNSDSKKADRPPIIIPDEGILSLDDFIGVYLDELQQGKFWGVAWDLARLGEPLPVDDVFEGRYDRMYCSKSLLPVAVLDTPSEIACPNDKEPSDHLPIAASFRTMPC